MPRSGIGIVSASRHMGDKERWQAQMGSDCGGIGFSPTSCRRFCRPITIIHVVDTTSPSLEDYSLQTDSACSESAGDCKFLDKSV